MENTKLEIEFKPISYLRPDQNNARKHDAKNIDAIASSLARFGQRKPIVIVGDGTVVAGNGTVEAAKQLGWTELACVRIPWRWTPDEIKAYALADNRTAELAEWDSSMLADQLLELDAVGWDISDLGFPELNPEVLVENDGSGLFDDEGTTLVFNMTTEQANIVQSALTQIKQKLENQGNDKNFNSRALVLLVKEWQSQ